MRSQTKGKDNNIVVQIMGNDTELSKEEFKRLIKISDKAIDKLISRNKQINIDFNLDTETLEHETTD